MFFSHPHPSDMPLDAPTHRGDRVRVLGPGAPRILAFVPAAFTPVCGDEVGELAQLAQRADRLRVELMIVSCDAAPTLARWLQEVDHSGLLLGVSDHWPHGRVARACSAFDGELGTARRHTWAVRADGTRILAAACEAGEQRAMALHERALEWAAAED
ncbi:redoxin domain-containing protein [Gulosibacter sp. 10]|uniref:redoxin domain-containing protein n=1 Tax=Gulosibacter sp. 10 TaxID=1255570 RepID=UPI00097F370D|nr:redoxin domain-containing protein [Gulosibacter sp. 10]SJM49297.1 Alkyl hydroperoxide reductase subunit C-like protein [Gulosibacter sp. 10]